MQDEVDTADLELTIRQALQTYVDILQTPRQEPEQCQNQPNSSIASK